MQKGYKTALALSMLTLFTVAGCAHNAPQMSDNAAPAAESTEGAAPAEETATEAAAAAPSAEPPAAADVTATAPASDAETSAAAPAPDAASSAAAVAPAETMASAAPAPAPAPSEEDKQKQELAAKLLAMPPQDVSKTIQTMTKHPRVRWLSSSGQYAYYVGGEFNAEYNPGKKVFTISSDSSEDKPVSCQYNASGELVNNKKGDQSMKAECNGLVSKLSNYLSN